MRNERLSNHYFAIKNQNKNFEPIGSYPFITLILDHFLGVCGSTVSRFNVLQTVYYGLFIVKADETPVNTDNN